MKVKYFEIIRGMIVLDFGKNIDAITLLERVARHLSKNNKFPKVENITDFNFCFDLLSENGKMANQETKGEKLTINIFR